MSRTSQLGLIQLGLMQPGSVDSGTVSGFSASVSDTSSLTESVSVSVIGSPWLLEASVSDAVFVAESASFSVSAAPVNSSALLLLGVG